jgi:hypothetical protein
VHRRKFFKLLRACADAHRLRCGRAISPGGALYFGIPLWYGLLFPVGYTAGTVMAIDSLRLRLRDQVTWKGRTYP